MTPVGADVIVIGLGAMGSATLAELARRGVRAIGLEQGSAIGHSNGSSHGGTRVIRKAYAEEPRYVPLVLRAYELWRRLEGETEPGLLTVTGGLHLGPPDHRSILSISHAADVHGLSIERLASSEVRRRFPAFDPCDGDVGLLEPDAGVLAIERAIESQAEVAVRLGADVRLGVSATAVEEDGEGVAVATSTGERLLARRVVVCSGGWLSDGKPLRLRVKLDIDRQVQSWYAPTQPALFEEDFPIFIHHSPLGEFYGLRDRERGGVKVCRHYGGLPTKLDDLDREVHPSDETEVRNYLRRHLRAADGPRIAASVCFYTNTPDQHFVIGAVPGCDRVLVAGGFSGHGFKFAPVVGEILADLACDGSTSHDIAMFEPARFG